MADNLQSIETLMDSYDSNRSRLAETQKLVNKWEPTGLLEGLQDSNKQHGMAVLLENQARQLIDESSKTGTASNSEEWSGVALPLVRRIFGELAAQDFVSVQPMNLPSGLIFYLDFKYGTAQTGAHVQDSYIHGNTSASNADASGGLYGAGKFGYSVNNQVSSVLTLDSSVAAGTYTTGSGMTTAEAETLGDGTDEFAEMAFSIDKVTVTAKSRALKAEYTMELAQDLKAIHGLDAETELANILSSEILAEINREVVRTIYTTAKAGAQVNTTTAGIFDLDTDSNGRWSVEKFKGLLYQLERDANAIGQQTRRGKGNIIICSADVASALQMAGVLDYAPALATNLNVDDTGNTFAGVLNGKFKVYVDPYSANVSASQFYVAGYKGTSPYDSGIFYCPYVPLQMVRAVGQDSFQPKIGFKTRYGMVANPFATSNGAGAIDLTSPAAGDQNVYYRRVKVTNIM